MKIKLCPCSESCPNPPVVKLDYNNGLVGFTTKRVCLEVAIARLQNQLVMDELLDNGKQ